MEMASANEIFEGGKNDSSIFQEGTLTDDNLSVRPFSYTEPLSPAQKKLSSDLLRLSSEKSLSHLSHGDTPAALRASTIELKNLRQTPFSEPVVISGAYVKNIPSRTVEKVYVYIYLESSANSSVLDSYCEVTERDEENHIAVAWVSSGSLEILASLPEVKNIQTVVPPLLRQEDGITKGDSVLRTESLRELYDVNGTGIKIGVLSDGVDNLAQVQTSGALPSDIHVLSNKIGGKEGTAMLEIIYSGAPGAELYFHDCGESRLEFNNAFDALVNEGCTIICDDIGWVSEPFFEDGIVASHIQNVIQERDILYVSSAGNSGDSHYQGFFYDNGNGWHDFSGGQREKTNLQLEIKPSGEVWVFFEWDDRWESSGNNYDLFLVDDNSEILESSEVYQNGDDLPLEYIMYTNREKGTFNASIKIRKTSGEARELELFIYCWPGVTVERENLVAKDSIFGHPALPEVVTVGAVNINESGTYRIEDFSSLGPATIAYPAREIRSKADLSGVDGVNITGLDGFTNKFYGTSASAPLVAAVAGLIWSAFPDKSEMDLKRLLYTSSIDIGEPGYDTVCGYGLVDAIGMYEKAAKGPVTFTVNQNGSGDFSSLTAAINQSCPGDIILVHPGIYRENVAVPWALSILAASGRPNDTIVEAASSEGQVFHVTGNSASIKGFNIRGSVNMNGIYLESASNCTLENNLISGCNQGILLEGAFNNTIIFNNISNNTEGFRLEASFLNNIQENEFDNNDIIINEISKKEISMDNIS
jgi:parallel beta-helix repeat protein